MSEISKLYENAEVKKQIPRVCSSNELYCKECEAHIEDAMPYCKNAEYPPFTAEKQIELIKWLAIRFNSNYMSCWHNETKNVWIFRLHELTELSSEEPNIYEGRNKDFTKALCNLINNLWQDLTEEEKQQVKGILE